MTENEGTIRNFIGAWSRLDVDEIVSYFAEDGVYHNMPFKPVRGHAALKDFISNFIKDWTRTEWDVLTLVSAGDVLVAERLDRTKLGDRGVDLPCCGIFEMRDGKIRVWRDYFDLATYTSGVSKAS
jgi:limonene-1,2-epoxide hydrolase